MEDGFRTGPAGVYVVSKHGKGAWMNVTLKEGHKRQIREMGIQTGLPVVRIVRVRIGELRLGSLKPKEWRHLTTQEVAALQKNSPGTQAKNHSTKNKNRPLRPVFNRLPAKNITDKSK